MRRQSARQFVYLGVIVLGAAAQGLPGATVASGQTIIYSRGQNVVPAFEGWEQNPDETYSLWFGYMNRNMDEKVRIPIGPDNKLVPGPLDAGQPTYFQPRRNRYVFQVTVPSDFGTNEVVWTLTSHGKTESAYGSLRVDYVVDDLMKMMDTGGLGVTESSARTKHRSSASRARHTERSNWGNHSASRHVPAMTASRSRKPRRHCGRGSRPRSKTTRGGYAWRGSCIEALETRSPSPPSSSRPTRTTEVNHPGPRAGHRRPYRPTAGFR